MVENLLIAAALSASQPVVIIGPGLERCGIWLEARRENGPEMIALSAWLGGYLSAHNQYGFGNGDVLGGARLEDARLWIDNYCRANPMRQVKTAADAFIASTR